MQIPARHRHLTFLGGWAEFVNPEEAENGDPPSGGIPYRAISSNWPEGMIPSEGSTAYVQVQLENLFIYDPANGRLWHFTVPEEELQRMRETEQVVVVDPPPDKSEGKEIAWIHIPVRPDAELTSLITSRN